MNDINGGLGIPDDANERSLAETLRQAEPTPK